MGLRDLLKKKDRISEDGEAYDAQQPSSAGAGAHPQPEPEFTFVRTTTNTREIISPPSFRSQNQTELLSPTGRASEDTHKRFSGLSLHSDAEKKEKSHRRLSERFHLSRGNSSTSVNLPEDLPTMGPSTPGNEQEEMQWEKRATILAQKSPVGPVPGGRGSLEEYTQQGRRRSVSVGDAQTDATMQEAIRLHESGDLKQSAVMFGRLADPNGANNPMGQIMYGLCLRHGWGVPIDAAQATQFFQYAASNSALVEQLALNNGQSKGGVAKGELSLAIFELGNGFFDGQGVKKDLVAARTYYETAANLGDTQAMCRAGLCYKEGFGCRKNMETAAKYYRRAAELGEETWGESWIWKDKYGGPKKTPTKH